MKLAGPRSELTHGISHSVALAEGPQTLLDKGRPCHAMALHLVATV